VFCRYQVAGMRSVAPKKRLFQPRKLTYTPTGKRHLFSALSAEEFSWPFSTLNSKFAILGYAVNFHPENWQFVEIDLLVTETFWRDLRPEGPIFLNNDRRIIWSDPEAVSPSVHNFSYSTARRMLQESEIRNAP